jgi:acylphosphatase
VKITETAHWRSNVVKIRLLATAIFIFTALGVSSAENPKDPPAKPVARMIHYTGKVQGVGFRATAVEIARDYPVTGWVKNLDDGRVELLVEGSEEDAKKFLEAVRTRWKKNIEKEEMDEKKPTGEFKGFVVRY